jgi:hypothetical protein
MEEITLQELKALVAQNSRAISRLEELQVQDREQLLLSRQQWHEELAASRQQWQEELAASRREHDRMLASLERSMSAANHQLVFDISRPAGFEPGSSQTDPSGWHG